MAELMLRDYQKTFVADVDDAWNRTRSVIGWMPTGAGKTEVAVHYALLEQRSGGCLP
jgi:superfamily II DNA or RNA helicase